MTQNLTCLAVQGLGELVNRRRHFQPLIENSPLPLQPNIAGPFDKASEVPFGLDVLSWGVKGNARMRLKLLVKFITEATRKGVGASAILVVPSVIAIFQMVNILFHHLHKHLLPQEEPATPLPQSTSTRGARRHRCQCAVLGELVS